MLPGLGWEDLKPSEYFRGVSDWTGKIILFIFYPFDVIYALLLTALVCVVRIVRYGSIEEQ